MKKKMEVKPPLANSEVVVSVRFKRNDFDEVAKCAERLGLRVSTYIRMAALAYLQNTTTTPGYMDIYLSQVEKHKD